MLNVFIVEDNQMEQDMIKKYVEHWVELNKYDMQVVIATENPYAVIDYLEKNEGIGIYFLDVDLGDTMDGITLGVKIRKYDPRGFLVVLTTHAEALSYAFKHKLEALDFIYKDDFSDVERRVGECLMEANRRHTDTILQNLFTLKNFNAQITIDASKILWFEKSDTNKNHVKIITTDGAYEFFGTFSDFEETLKDNFFRCHKSHIVNLNQIKKIDFVHKKIFFEGSSDGIPISRESIKDLKKIKKWKKT